MAQSSGGGGRVNNFAAARATGMPARSYTQGVWVTLGSLCGIMVVTAASVMALVRITLPHLAADDVDAVARVVYGCTAAAGIAASITVWLITRVVGARLARALGAITATAEAVAAGDLSVDFTASQSSGAHGRLSRAIAAMLGELRRLTSTIADSATRTATMAAEITTGADQMSASASEIATTSSVLSEQATEMAQTLQDVHGDAARLVEIAGELSTGAREGVERNVTLRALADMNRTRLDASAAALTVLASEVSSSAAAVEGVATASEEIRAFVALVQKMARQSKLLALNAAMEAARAGEQGAGFAVVANEVRRLAANSNDAAERTVTVVNEVLARVAESRASSAQTVHTVADVLAASREGARTFGEVSEALVVAERWTASIADAATRSNGLVAAMTRQLDLLAHGTESFAAAMEQVAASSEQQSASTHEIAAAAATLTTHASGLSTLAESLDGQAAAAWAEPDAPAAAAVGVERYSAASATQPMRPAAVRTAA